MSLRHFKFNISGSIPTTPSRMWGKLSYKWVTFLKVRGCEDSLTLKEECTCNIHACGRQMYINTYTPIPEVQHMNLTEPQLGVRAVIKDVLRVTGED